MTSDSEIREALVSACKRMGSQKALAEKTGIKQGRISDYINERYDVGNCSINTLRRFFPELRLVFFPDTDLTPDIQEINRMRQEYTEKLANLEKDRKLFEQEKEIYRLKRENEELKKHTPAIMVRN